jgi:tetratricopeptide (TPR) repeat protein
LEDSTNVVERILDLTGWTHARLVHEMGRAARILHEPEPFGLDIVTVNRWKRGRQSPSAYYRRLLRTLYAAIHGEPVTRIDEVDEMRRRRFLAYTAALAGQSILDPQRLTAALEHGIRGDVQLVDRIASAVRAHAGRWYRLSPAALLPAVRDELAAVDELRAKAAFALRRRLTRLTGEAAALAGWLAWHSGNHDAADAYYLLAHSLAVDIEDREATAFVQTARSFLHSRLFQPAAANGRALGLLDEAERMTDHGSSPYLRTWVLSRRAEELAAAGRAREADAELERATAALASAGDPDDGFFGYLDANRLTGCRGTCAMLLRRPRAAGTLLESALEHAPNAPVEERSVLVADLAAAHAMQGEVEEACVLLRRSLTICGPDNAARIGRVRAIRGTHLAAWSTVPAVRDLDELIV